MERECLATCDSKGCINLAMVRADCQDAIDVLRSSHTIISRAIDVRFVGAWRGGSREEFGHALDGYESEPGDEYHNTDDDPMDGYGSETVETPDEVRGRVDFGSGGALAYDEEDAEATFSDHEGWEKPDFVGEHEVWDLREDEQTYQSSLDSRGDYYETKQGLALGLLMERPEAYYEWRKQQGGKIFPIYHLDGSYRAI